MLCFIMIFVFTLTIAYAALSITLNITGTAKVNAVNWDIHLENAVVNSNSSVTNVPVVNGSTASFSIELNKPGDFYEFTVDVVNAGGIDAVISSITKSGLTTDQEKYLNYTITYQNGESVTNNQLISANTSQRLLVKLEYRRDLVASDLPSTTQTLNLSFVVNYVQSSGSGISVPGNGKTLISFSIGGISYQAEEGMTWAKWIDSTYNMTSLVYPTETSRIMDSNNTEHKVLFGNPKDQQFVHADEIIENNGEYFLHYDHSILAQNEPCPDCNSLLIEFTIDGISYYAEEGMTWSEWVNSGYNTLSLHPRQGDVWGESVLWPPKIICVSSDTIFSSAYAGYAIATKDFDGIQSNPSGDEYCNSSDRIVSGEKYYIVEFNDI